MLTKKIEECRQVKKVKPEVWGKVRKQEVQLSSAKCTQEFKKYPETLKQSAVVKKEIGLQLKKRPNVEQPVAKLLKENNTTEKTLNEKN